MKYLEMIDIQLRSGSQMSLISPRGMNKPPAIPQSTKVGGKSMQVNLGESLTLTSRNLSLTKKPTSIAIEVSKQGSSSNVFSPKNNKFKTSKEKTQMMQSAMEQGLKKAFDDNHPSSYESVIDSLQVPLRVPLDLSYS